MIIANQARQIAKTSLHDALHNYAGNPKHPVVAAAIAQLVALNPTNAPAWNHDLMDGQWRLISAPSFPDGELQPDGTYVYSLGRLAFNMFQPTQLKVVIQRVWQPVLPILNSDQRTHDIVVEFTTVDGNSPGLQGIVYNLGVCEPCQDDVLQVQFTGGALTPQAEQSLETWQAVFGQQTQPVRSGLRDSLSNLWLKMMFGLVPPQGMDDRTGQVTFTMQRSPKGKLTVLYLDETLRITRGEKGTILVCERQTLTSPDDVPTRDRLLAG